MSEASTQHNRLDPEDFFATPVIWTPQSSDPDEVEYEIRRQIKREFALHYWLNQEMDTDAFLDAMNENGVDPVQAVDDWENDLTYLWG